MEFTVADKNYVMEPGDELYYPANLRMAARNLLNGPSEFLQSIKW